ncbi:SAGA complex subunit Sgf73 [Malassezia vespertilionis]|uniref:SCA7 domain-containing protein n=1 Tax=Malassezia vespertilionis TaxID=2020962 RepID=A0A2N1J7S3_9BASI|nr:SAGA complex subunit Sgf73 [Malassezia vespertilionis]PKI82593.1 hypothetical protein MVES_003419 [Malassezia vespertilionis]WFD08486.1 SAGA complex subunit Sgf73 [Malassezia vespertilionis]
MADAAGGWDALIEGTESGALAALLTTEPPHPGESPLQRPWRLDETDVSEFGGFALDDDVDIVACEHCSKPVLREAYTFHIQNCEMARAIANGSLSPSILRSTKLGTESLSAAPSAKDKVPKTEETPEMDMRRRKGFGGKKNRGPINLDRQCGVINNKGLPCSRSLTCKSHSMGAKRNVPGRSQPYDTLLFEWQKATNPAFVARLEEKERAIAAARAASQSKDKKRKVSANDRGGRAEGAEGSVEHRSALVESMTNMYHTNATYQEVDADLFSTLQTIYLSATRDRTTILPLATRRFAGQYTERAKRFRVLRQFLAQGLAGTAHVRARMENKT